MVNKKENRKRKLPEYFFKQMFENDRVRKNSKYGEFIIQTNEVQKILTILILLRTFKPYKKFKKYLERITLGNLINNFRICVKNSEELLLVKSLELYNESRNALAHKMFTKDELTEKECKLSIELGEEILGGLRDLLRLLLPKKNNLNI